VAGVEEKETIELEELVQHYPAPVTPENIPDVPEQVEEAVSDETDDGPLDSTDDAEPWVGEEMLPEEITGG